MKDNLGITYNGIEIVYDERESKFVFELRGREKKVDSLKAAKELIDKPVPKDKKPFERIKAHFYRYSKWETVEVTSIADQVAGWGGDYVWVVGSSKSREKTLANALYPCNPHNDALVSEHVELQHEIEQLRKTQQQLITKLTPLVLAKEVL